MSSSRNSNGHPSEQDSVEGKNRKSRSGHAWLQKSSFFPQHTSLLPRRGHDIQPSALRTNETGQTRSSWSMTDVGPIPFRDSRRYYGPQLHSSLPNNRGYYGIKYPSFIWTQDDHNSLLGPNNEECFGPELASILPYGRRIHDSYFTPAASSKGQYEPYRPSPPYRQPHESSSALSLDSEYYTAKRQFSSPDDSGASLLRDSSLEDSRGTSHLQVSIVPSVSFSIQDAAHLGLPAAFLEDPLALGRNVPYVSGTARARTLESQ